VDAVDQRYPSVAPFDNNDGVRPSAGDEDLVPNAWTWFSKPRCWSPYSRAHS